MFLPKIDSRTIEKYIELEHKAGTSEFAADCINEIKKENPQLWDIMGVMSIAIGEPGRVATILSYVLMTYKLLRIQAEDDLMERLFKE